MSGKVEPQSGPRTLTRGKPVNPPPEVLSRAAAKRREAAGTKDVESDEKSGR